MRIFWKMRPPSGCDPRTCSIVFMEYYNSVLLFFVLGSISDLRTTAEIMGDECDWTRSLLSTTERGVTPVYLRCSAGRVTWLYPRGALRVLLRLPGQDREFRACIRIQPEVDYGNIDGHRHRTAALAARLFLEGPRSLLPLYVSNDGGNKVIRCFNSKNGQAAIYVEASEFNTMSKRIAEFEYDLHALPKGVRAYDPFEECRPCTSEELAHTFCTSDLVTRGTIRGIKKHDDMQISQVSIRVTKLIRNTIYDSRELETNTIPDEAQNSLSEVILHVGQHCEVSHGLGEFVFMARKKLGDLTLQCAPRLEEWTKLVNKLSEEGTAHCVLRS